MPIKWFDGLGDINRFDILRRLKINQDGNLEVDGQPQVGGGNGEMAFAVKEYWTGNANITKTFSSSMYGFDITNDGSSDLTFTINGMTITVKAGEVFSDIFEAFTSVTITSTVPYRACVKESLSGTLSPSPSPSNDTTPPVISISPVSGTYMGSQQITLSSNETANIYYTLDGSTPTTSSTKYTAPFTVSANITVKYLGVDLTGNQSTVQSATYTINQPDTTAPNPVTNLVAGTVTTTSIPVSWTKSTSTDVANYEVAYSTNGTNFTVASNAINSSSTSYTVSGLTSNTNYTIRVTAIDTSGNRSTSVTVTATTAVPADTTPPNDVTNLATSNVTDTSLTLTWTASNSTDIASYDVYNGSSLLGNTTSITYNVTGLSPTTSYTFKVVSKDTSGNASTGVTVTVSTIVSSSSSTTIISDSFNRADVTPTASNANTLGTTEIGSKTWVNTDSNIAYGIKGNQAYMAYSATGGVKNRKPVTVSVDVPNYAVELTLSVFDTTTSGYESVFARTGNGQLQLRKDNNGYYTILSTPNGGSPTAIRATNKTPVAGDRIRLECYSDGRIKTFINGVADVEVQDTAGLGAVNNIGFGCETNVSRFDDFKVEKLDPRNVDTTPPEVITGLRVYGITSTGCTIEWQESTSLDVDRYEVYQNGNLITTIHPPISTYNTLSYNPQNLVTKTTYNFDIKTIDYDGNISTSSISMTTA